MHAEYNGKEMEKREKNKQKLGRIQKSCWGRQNRDMGGGWRELLDLVVGLGGGGKIK